MSQRGREGSICVSIRACQGKKCLMCVCICCGRGVYLCRQNQQGNSGEKKQGRMSEHIVCKCVSGVLTT